MKKLWLWVALAILASTTTAGAAPRAIDGRGYRMVNEWDFKKNVGTPASMRWQFHTRFVNYAGTLDYLNNEWQRYRDNGNHEFGPTGMALVARAPRGLVSGGIESGMIRSKWTGVYGYFEARIKVPPGRGMWPTFWLLPQDEVWPPEIDVVEIVNNGNDTTKNSYHFVHAGLGDTPTYFSKLDQWQRYTPGFDYSAGFHVFAVLWEPGRVRHYVDDVLVVDRKLDWLHKDGRSAGPAHILVNLAVGGTWPGPPISLDDFPARMYVDFIRVWQK